MTEFYFHWRCKICNSDWRNYIECLLLYKNMSQRKIAKKMCVEGFKISQQNISHHLKHICPEARDFYEALKLGLAKESEWFDFYDMKKTEEKGESFEEVFLSKGILD